MQGGKMCPRDERKYLGDYAKVGLQIVGLMDADILR